MIRSAIFLCISCCVLLNRVEMDTSRMNASAIAVRSEGSRWPCSIRHTFPRPLHPNKKATSCWPRLDRFRYVRTELWSLEDMVVAQMNLQLRLYAPQRIKSHRSKIDGRNCRKRQQTDAQQPKWRLLQHCVHALKCAALHPP